MTRGASLSMVMIARNESHNVRRCFASFWDHVDEVVLCDTGSRDGTVAEARRFAKRRREPGKLIVGHFE
jgi:glycosyltransferase involved in cell wall biosynthesis